MRGHEGAELGKSSGLSNSGGGMMFSRLNLIYLILCICGAAVDNAHLPPTPSILSGYWWAAVAFSYALCLVLGHCRLKFWRGFLALLFMLTISHLFELIVILLGESGGILHPDGVTVVLFGFRFIGPGGCAIVWYPLGYLLSWFVIWRRTTAAS